MSKEYEGMSSSSIPIAAAAVRLYAIRYVTLNSACDTQLEYPCAELCATSRFQLSLGKHLFALISLLAVWLAIWNEEMSQWEDNRHTTAHTTSTNHFTHSLPHSLCCAVRYLAKTMCLSIPVAFRSFVLRLNFLPANRARASPMWNWTWTQFNTHSHQQNFCSKFRVNE